MARVDTWKSPVLLIHGDDDRNVSFIESINLITALRKQKVEVEQLVFPDEVHDFLRHQNWVRGYKATAEFFNRRLKNKAATETQRHCGPSSDSIHGLRGLHGLGIARATPECGSPTPGFARRSV